MGTINSRSQLPATPTYTSVSVPVTPTAPSEPVKTDAQIAAEGRTESLLRRSRGTLGTILTGFKGFLSSSDTSTTNSRKTLLGE